MNLNEEEKEIIQNCGELLELLKIPFLNEKNILTKFQFIKKSNNNSLFSYLISISNNKCYISLNSEVYIDKLLEIQYPNDIFKGISSDYLPKNY